jgi:hypothetical protein
MMHKQNLELNTSKAYAFLREQCAKAMQNKIESSPKYETIIKGITIGLLKAIKQHAVNYQEHRYEMSIIFDALRTMINLKQKRKMNHYQTRQSVSRQRETFESRTQIPNMSHEVQDSKR